MNIDDVQKTQATGGMRFSFKGFGPAGDERIHSWTSSCVTFAVELSAHRSLLEKGKYSRVEVWRETDYSMRWTLTRSGVTPPAPNPRP